MRLHNRESYITDSEPPVAKKRVLPKITQLLYFLFLIVIAVYVVYFFIHRAMSFTAVGIVDVEKVTLRAGIEGVVNNLVLPGQAVKKGDMLAIIHTSEICDAAPVNRELERLKAAKDQTEIELDQLSAEKNYYEQLLRAALNTNSLRRALEVNAPLALSNEVKDIKQDIAKVDREYAATKREINALNKRINLEESRPVAPLPKNCFDQEIIAPVDGVVSATGFEDNARVKQGEPVMALTDAAPSAVVRFHLPYEEKGDLAVGDLVSVALPNGTDTTGIVKRSGSSAEGEIAMQLNNYQPVIPTLEVVVSPANESDLPLWRSFDRQVVEVRGSR